ncbi:MAG: hypothetical protein KF880_07840 [Ferruginibacter sp.]|nr:hypothetical protein [Ferruginibacter sp.]
MRHIIILPLLSFFSSFSQNYIREGVVEKINYTIKLGVGVNANDTLLYKSNKIWFSDSMVIIEAKVVFHPNDNEKSVGLKYPVYKFIFLDLKTMRYQDYFSFSDTAFVQCNYKTTGENEFVEWRFWRTGLHDSEKFDVLGDTLIHGIQYTLLKTVGKEKQKAGIHEYHYMRCNVPQLIFHIRDGGIEQNFKGCKVFKYEMFSEILELVDGIEFRFLSDTLTDYERSIFKQWSENAKTTDIPLINSLDAYFRCGPEQSPLIPKDF